MKKKIFFILIIANFFGSQNLLFAQTPPTIQMCSGLQEVCIDSSLFEACVTIIIDPNYTDPIDHFEIDWGDGTPITSIPASTNPPNQMHLFDLSNFFGTCAYSNNDFAVRLNTYLSDGLIINNAFFPTFLNPPTTDFTTDTPIICTGDEICFNNQTCPDNDGNMVYFWDFDNGFNSSGVNPCITYTTPGVYNATLTATNACGTDTKTIPITVFNPPVADISFVETGTINTDTIANTPYHVTFTNSSTNPAFFHWEITHNGSEVFDSITPLPMPITYSFDVAGTYIVTMELNTVCGNVIWEQTFTILEPLLGTISGAIQSPNNIAIPDVLVRLAINGEIQLETLTDSLGAYRFEDLPFGENYEITPYLNEYSGNNVSLVDLTIMRHHNFLAGNNTLLDSPYKLIAADINGDDTIDLTDLNNSMHLLIYKEMPSTVTNTLWRFVPTDYIFGNPLMPWIPMFPESRIIPILDGDDLTNHFIGIQIGDVN